MRRLVLGLGLALQACGSCTDVQNAQLPFPCSTEADQSEQAEQCPDGWLCGLDGLCFQPDSTDVLADSKLTSVSVTLVSPLLTNDTPSFVFAGSAVGDKRMHGFVADGQLQTFVVGESGQVVEGTFAIDEADVASIAVAGLTPVVLFRDGSVARLVDGMLVPVTSVPPVERLVQSTPTGGADGTHGLVTLITDGGTTLDLDPVGALETTGNNLVDAATFVTNGFPLRYGLTASGSVEKSAESWQFTLGSPARRLLVLPEVSGLMPMPTLFAVEDTTGAWSLAVQRGSQLEFKPPLPYACPGRAAPLATALARVGSGAALVARCPASAQAGGTIPPLTWLVEPRAAGPDFSAWELDDSPWWRPFVTMDAARQFCVVGGPQGRTWISEEGESPLVMRPLLLDRTPDIIAQLQLETGPVLAATTGGRVFTGGSRLGLVASNSASGAVEPVGVVPENTNLVITRRAVLDVANFQLSSSTPRVVAVLEEGAAELVAPVTASLLRRDWGTLLVVASRDTVLAADLTTIEADRFAAPVSLQVVGVPVAGVRVQDLRVVERLLLGGGMGVGTRGAVSREFILVALTEIGLFLGVFDGTASNLDFVETLADPIELVSGKEGGNPRLVYASGIVATLPEPRQLVPQLDDTLFDVAELCGDVVALGAERMYRLQARGGLGTWVPLAGLEGDQLTEARFYELKRDELYVANADGDVWKLAPPGGACP